MEVRGFRKVSTNPFLDMRALTPSSLGMLALGPRNRCFSPSPLRDVCLDSWVGYVLNPAYFLESLPPND